MRKVPFLIPAILLILMIAIADFFEIPLPFHSSVFYNFLENEGTIVGIVEEQKINEGSTRLVVRASASSFFKNKVSERVLAYGKGKFSIGSVVKVKGKFLLPEENTNDNLFNYRKYLKSKKIFVVIKKAEVEAMGTSGLSYALKNAFQSRVKEVFSRYTNPNTAKLLSAVFLADYDFLDESVREDFKKFGIIHLLSVSGLHITIISTLILYALSFLRIKRPVAAPIMLFILFLYAYLLDFKSPIFRAFVMTSVFQAAFLSYEPDSKLNDLCLSALIILILRPYDLFTVGFQFSFLAVLSIILILPKLSSTSIVISQLAVVVACQIGTLPVTFFAYHYFNPLVFVANLLITPIFTLILWTGALLFFPISLFPPLSAVFGKLLDFLVSLVGFAMTFLNHLPDFSRNIRTPNLYEFLLYAFMIWLIIGGKNLISVCGFELNFSVRRKLNGALKRMMICSLSLILAVDIISRFLYGVSLTVSMIDVGQGDGFLIRSKRKTIVCDTGGGHLSGDKIPKRITIPYLQSLGINNIDAVILSHYDADHAAGAPLLIENFKIKRFILPYPSRSKIFSIIKNSKIPKVFSKPNAIWHLDKDTSIRIIYPDGSEIPPKEGNLSMIFLLSYKNHSMLFTGDAEKEEERAVIDIIPHASVLKTAHHGSNTSSTREFLKKVSPKLALISCGRNNSYGHPAPEVLDRFSEMKIPVLRTDTQGEIILNFTDKGITYTDFLMRKNMRKRELLILLFQSAVGIFLMWIMAVNLNDSYEKKFD